MQYFTFEVLDHDRLFWSVLVALLGAKVTVTSEIEVEALGGVADRLVNIVSRHANSLKFCHYCF